MAAKDTEEEAPTYRTDAEGVNYSGAGGYENPLQLTGSNEQAGTIKLFDPLTGTFITKQLDPDDPFKYNPSGDETNWAYLPNGQTVMMDTSGEGWKDTGGRQYEGQFEGDWVWAGTGGGGDETAPPPSPNDGDGLGLGGYQPGGGGGGPGPTDDWPAYPEPPGYENVPQPGGDGSFVEGGPPADTSWDWDAFRAKAPGDRQWGGYDTDYQAFERYQPGMDSPWGMPNIVGGNEDFYQQQFVNLLRDEQGFQNRQRGSQAAQQYAYENPLEATPIDWSWANQGQGLQPAQPAPLGGSANPNPYGPAGPMSAPGYANPVPGFEIPAGSVQAPIDYSPYYGGGGFGGGGRR